MNYPSNECGECSVWLALGESEGISRAQAISEHCSKCELYKQHRYLRHIPTQCCYEILDEYDTIEICGVRLRPVVDEVVFWEYTDKYVEKVITPSDPYANNR